MNKQRKPLAWLHGEVKTPQTVIDVCKARLKHYKSI